MIVVVHVNAVVVYLTWYSLIYIILTNNIVTKFYSYLYKSLI